MIINFRVSNLLSFKDEVQFSALASSERQHGKRVFRFKKLGVKLLPVAAIYGGNAAGKSNLFHALEFAKDIVTKTKRPEEGILRVPFRLDPKCRSAPSKFGFDLLIGESAFRYEFAVTNQLIISESLSYLRDGDAEVIFKRSAEANGKQIWSETSFRNLNLTREDHEFLWFKTRDTLANQLFLASVRGRKISVLEEVGNWFANELILMSPQSEFQPTELNIMNLKSFEKYCVDALEKGGTGICGINNENIALEDLPLPEKLKERIQNDLKSNTKSFIILRGPNRLRFMIRRKGDSVVASKLTTYRMGTDHKRFAFEIGEESEGTERFLDLVPAFYELSNPLSNKVFFIDELDRSLHTRLTRELIESFLTARTPHSRSQLFFTTHDPMLMDQDLLRRDEVWFVDKLKDGSSELTALSDFKGVRYDKDIRKSYLLGRFAGLPDIQTLPAVVHGQK